MDDGVIVRGVAMVASCNLCLWEWCVWCVVCGVGVDGVHEMRVSAWDGWAVMCVAGGWAIILT